MELFSSRWRVWGGELTNTQARQGTGGRELLSIVDGRSRHRTMMTAGLHQGSKCSGHSGRVGLYTAASEAGIAIEAVAALVRHKSLNVAQKYARKANQLRRAPSKNPALSI